MVKAGLNSLVLALLCVAAPARAFQVEGLGGAEIDTKWQGYQYLGAGVERYLDDNWGIRLRALGSHVRYRFEASGSDRTGNIWAVTPSAGAVYKNNKGLVAGLAVGPDVRTTKRTLPAGGSETMHETGVAVQAEADWWFGGYNDFSLLATYASVDDFFWSRARYKRQVTNLGYDKPFSWFVGGDLSGSGNADYDAFQVGPMIECAYRPANVSAALKGGYKHTNTYSSAGYFGIEIYARY